MSNISANGVPQQKPPFFWTCLINLKFPSSFFATPPWLIQISVVSQRGCKPGLSGLIPAKNCKGICVQLAQVFSCSTADFCSRQNYPEGFERLHPWTNCELMGAKCWGQSVDCKNPLSILIPIIQFLCTRSLAAGTLGLIVLSCSNRKVTQSNTQQHKKRTLYWCMQWNVNPQIVSYRHLTLPAVLSKVSNQV